ncbi:MAG: hypothetical protein ACYSUQ_08105 [Planctomycetota bacterium]
MTPPRTSSVPHPGSAGLHFRIGAIDVSVRSEAQEVLEDFAAIYGESRQSRAAPADAINMEVRRGRRSYVSGRRRYVIWADGESLGKDRRCEEVLPYLDWGINWRVIATRADYLQLHAAVMVRAGCGVLFAAGSGAGKSTLAAGLLARGWRYLSDEIALIDTDTLRVHAFPKALCIKSGAFQVVQDLNLPLWRRRHYVKAVKGQVGYVNPHAVNPESVGGSAPIRFVIFPRYVPGTEPRVFAVPRAEAAFKLSGHVLNRDAFGHKLVAALGDVVRHSACFRLESGPLAPTCALIEELVSDSGRRPARGRPPASDR